jgi:hypothetical protein
MELGGMDLLKKFEGQEVKEVRTTDISLTLGFEKKILFIKSKAYVIIDSSESLNGLAVNSIVSSRMEDISFDGQRLKIKFARDNAPSYTLMFKAVGVRKA